MLFIKEENYEKNCEYPYNRRNRRIVFYRSASPAFEAERTQSCRSGGRQHPSDTDNIRNVRFRRNKCDHRHSKSNRLRAGNGLSRQHSPSFRFPTILTVRRYFSITREPKTAIRLQPIRLNSETSFKAVDTAIFLT